MSQKTFKTLYFRKELFYMININYDELIANLSVKELDHNLLETDSEELDIITQYFASITCNNKDIEKLLWECLGYSLTKTAKLRRAFIFKGNGANGKSKLFRILEHLLGSEQCSHEHLENLSGSKAGGKTTIKNLCNCTVNISEDQKQPKYINNSLVTRIISGETIAYGDEEITPYATMLFSVNEVINFKETGLHITDRIVVIPFNNTFTDSNNNRDINMEDKLCSEKSLRIIATKALESFQEVLDNGKFSIPPIVEEETKKYFLECNNVAEFCSLYPVETIIVKSRYYQEYRNWCNYNNREAVSNNIFGKEVLALGYRAERYSFRNDRKTYYAAPDFDNNNSQAVYNEYITSSGLSKESINSYTDKELDEYYKVKSFDDFLSEKLNCQL